MNDSTALLKRQLFPVRLADYLPDAAEKACLLYAPLSHDFVLLDTDELEALADGLAECDSGTGASRPEHDRLLPWCLTHSSDALPKANYAMSPSQVRSLTILPNNICNFSCSYCYAAKGHGSDELDEETIRAALDWFVNPGRTTERDLYISFGGGGEPLLSWPRVRFALRHSRELALRGGFRLHYSYASNGSVIDNEIVSAIKEFAIKVNISFDILEDVQDRQRGSYRLVAKTLDTLLLNAIFPTVNSVITPLNVHRQCEMVEHVHARFPGLRRLSFDHVEGYPFSTVDGLRNFYDDYTENFYSARSAGVSCGIDVSSIKHHNVSLLKQRACAGGFDLCPDGSVSVCFLVSSPREALFDRFVYGSVHDGRVSYDESKFLDIVGRSTHSRPQCAHCFARWHCGGGCLYNTSSKSQEEIDAMCHFIRKFTLRALLEGVKN